VPFVNKEKTERWVVGGFLKKKKWFGGGGGAVGGRRYVNVCRVETIQMISSLCKEKHSVF